jgi:hypothetical protein
MNTYNKANLITRQDNKIKQGKRLPNIKLFLKMIAIAALISLFVVSIGASFSTASTVIRNTGKISLTLTSPLHVEGNKIKDADNNTIYLRGAGKIHWDDDPTGWWWPEGGAWYQGYCTWNENAVRYHLRQMKSWGMNVVRFHTVADWWIQDYVTLGGYSGSYRNNLKRTFEIAAQEGMYVIMDLFSPVNGSWMLENEGPPGIPFAPYTYYPEATRIFPDKQAFVNYWADVASELKNYNNVLFELYNEPHAEEAQQHGVPVEIARNDWFDAVQKAITAIRNTGAQNIIVVQWHMCAVPYMGWEAANAGDLTWIEQYPLNDKTGNILYSTHLYRAYLNPNWYDGYNYNYSLAAMENCKLKYVVENLSKPLIIGEIGVNMWFDGIELQRELDWARNVLNICNQWGISYSAWDWDIVDTWHLISLNGLPEPSEWGQILIDAIAQGGTRISSQTFLKIQSAFLQSLTSKLSFSDQNAMEVKIPFFDVAICRQSRNKKILL